MQRSARRLDVLVDDLLDVSRIDAGQLALDWMEFELEDLLDEIVGEFMPVFREKHQNIDWARKDKSITICGDRVRIAQVVTNLLSNAAKYSPSEETVFLSADSRGDMASITVRDRGIGMSREDRDNVFKPFFRASNPATKSEAATGLGLVIVKSIVELHGGNISFDSEQGVGTSVSVSFPKCGSAEHPDHGVLFR